MARRSKPNRPKDCKYIGKGGMKLDFALAHFQLDVAGLVAADFGSNQGGFVDCLLAHKAAQVYAVDTAYGVLHWSLRQDPRVIVCERTNAMHWRANRRLDLITIDVAWTRQKNILPNALRNLKDGGIILSLFKAQYEAGKCAQAPLSREQVNDLLAVTVAQLAPLFAEIDQVISPYPGSGGNIEAWLYLTVPQAQEHRQ